MSIVSPMMYPGGPGMMPGASMATPYPPNPYGIPQMPNAQDPFGVGQPGYGPPPGMAGFGNGPSIGSSFGLPPDPGNYGAPPGTTGGNPGAPGGQMGGGPSIGSSFGLPPDPGNYGAPPSATGASSSPGAPGGWTNPNQSLGPGVTGGPAGGDIFGAPGVISLGNPGGSLGYPPSGGPPSPYPTPSAPSGAPAGVDNGGWSFGGSPADIAAALNAGNSMGWNGAKVTGYGPPIGGGGGGFGAGAPSYPTGGFGVGGAMPGGGGGFNPPTYTDPTKGAGASFGAPATGAAAGAAGTGLPANQWQSSNPNGANYVNPETGLQRNADGTYSPRVPAGTPGAVTAPSASNPIIPEAAGGAAPAGGAASAPGQAAASGPNAGLVQALSGSTQGAINNANNANAALLQSVVGGYGNLLGGELGTLGQTTGQQFTNLSNLMQQNQGQAQQQLIDSGLNNSTVTSSVNRGIAQDYAQNLNNLLDSRLQEVLGLQNQAGTGALNALQSVNAQGPNPNQLPALTSGIGQSGQNPSVYAGSNIPASNPSAPGGGLDPTTLNALLQFLQQQGSTGGLGSFLSGPPITTQAA